MSVLAIEEAANLLMYFFLTYQLSDFTILTRRLWLIEKIIYQILYCEQKQIQLPIIAPCLIKIDYFLKNRDGFLFLPSKSAV